AGQGDSAAEPLTSGELEVALLERDRTHRAFRRITGARLDDLLTESKPAPAPRAGKSPGPTESG
ncbi:MAG: proteasome subunit alpha, partial [Actinobacteria bacterium]|nr:proteasome subunit alpha [Actinomycetota bacterium]